MNRSDVKNTGALPRRCLGRTELEVSPVSMGCWPITGMTSLDVTREQSLQTLQAAWDAGINFFDTAYMYGAHGESEQMIAEVLGPHRDELVIATKAGLEWDETPKRIYDAKPETIKRRLEESLQRLNTDRVELFYLHAPDPKTPIEDTAGAFAELKQEGKTLAVGVSNVSYEQLLAFQAVCPVDALQPPYNMLQRDVETKMAPWCIEYQVSICVYWPLMKGLLAGKLPRDMKFDPRDGRAKYPMFQGEQWEKNQDFLDELRPIAADAGCTLAELVINWTIQQPGITVAIAGAKRPEQIAETAHAMHWQLTQQQLDQIDAALARRGDAISRGAV